ncbi:DUF2252 family protein [Bradyrhizobium liaoningense]|uniref:DUF2252 family protein n=1 Tax=Bradyrhizobium liaoningense TaxID=43992 RepID=UPI001BAA2211|nr:DUF2252 family protein [Bradyrhizobium liaoningense]MBR0840833.1 DUF2252 family protein [Bradyrhizobium liaoningense]MBR0858581.1 DUF2252 family protein [Bradyrhizobium liaoningense]
MTFQRDNAAFERWLRSQCKVVEADLAHKHERMQKDAFTFLRATFFRWARRIEKLCPKLKDAPAVLSVGDTHIENYGTWRDAEGRLVWGINDFDEAAIIPYPFDLVRLATSARLAPKARVAHRMAAATILEGYREGLAKPAPSLLDEEESWMRPYVVCTDEERRDFWHEVKDYPDAKPPPRVASALRGNLKKARLVRFASRVKGGGGLGRPRYVAIAQWRGGLIVREAKALVPSAWNWAHDLKGAPLFLKLATGEFRAPDPHLDMSDRFIIRRIAPDQRKLDLSNRTGPRLRLDLLWAMGFDLGAVHAATGGAKAKIERDLDGRKDGWLHGAAKVAAGDVRRDFEEWRKVRLPWTPDAATD